LALPFFQNPPASNAQRTEGVQGGSLYEGGKLRHAGNINSGYTEDTVRFLTPLLEAAEIEASPAGKGVCASPQCHVRHPLRVEASHRRLVRNQTFAHGAATISGNAP
jgi:ATP-dependent DNA ligase